MSISTGTILKVVATLVWSDGNLMQNVFAAVISGAGGPWDEEDVVDDALAWVAAMYAEVVTGISDDCDGSQVQVYEFDTGDLDFDEVGTTAWTYNPTSAGDQLPRGVAALINAKTIDPDVNGKKYIGGFTEGTCTAGVWPSSTLTTLANFASEWLLPFTGGTTAADWVPAIFSPSTPSAFVCTGVAIIPAIPAYQRRRKRGVGI